jgi:hypothetical protein
MTRRRWIARTLLLALAGLVAWRSALADTASVPLHLQVDLCTKIIEYIQEPALLSLDRVRIGIVVKSSSPESTRAGAELKAAFDRAVMAGGRPHEQSIVEWSSAQGLVDEARSRSLMVLYFTPGLDAEIASSAAALVGRRIMTIGAVDSFVVSGVILGFELVSGHPKMVFNLKQAKKQEVVLRAAVMKLMRIVE